MKVNKLFFFFSSRCFLKEMENMFSVFLSSYRNSCKSLGELEKAVETLTWARVPQHFSFSQSSTRVSIKQLDYELKKRSLCPCCRPAPGGSTAFAPAAASPRGKHSLCPCCRLALGEAPSLPLLPPCPGGEAQSFPLLPPCPGGKHSLCPCCHPAPGGKRSLSPAATLPRGEAQSFPCCHPAPGGSTVFAPAATLPRGEAQSFPCCHPAPGGAQSFPLLPPRPAGSTVFPLLPPCPGGKRSLCPCCHPASEGNAVFEPAAVLTRARFFIKNMRVLFWAHPFPPLSSTICYLLTRLISRRFY